jgi:hypothetical protein
VKASSDHTMAFTNSPLSPSTSAQVTARLRAMPGRRFYVTRARVVAEFPTSWIGRLARLIPGVRRIFMGRDARDRSRATAQLKIDYVAVDNCARAPNEIDRLPAAVEGSEIRIVMINTGERSVVAHASVDLARAHQRWSSK